MFKILNIVANTVGIVFSILCIGKGSILIGSLLFAVNFGLLLINAYNLSEEL